MKMTGEQKIAASRQKVWEGLNDPAVLRQSIPGCQSLEKEEDGRLTAVVAIKIGPIGARFSGGVTLSNLDPPNGYTITGEGQGGTVGSAKGGAKVRLIEDQGGTLLSYEVDAQVGGRLAQLGGPIIDATAKRLAAKFFEQFSAVLGGPVPAAVAAPRAAASAAPVSHAPSHAAPARGFPVAWILALVVAALAGYLIGDAHGTAGQADWMGLAIGLLLMVIAAVSFEYGRRTAAPVVVLDPALLARFATDAGR
jgi:carbon monoxide dehydrogenase subunit G